MPFVAIDVMFVLPVTSHTRAVGVGSAAAATSDA
jgi:hypothetical protein